MMLCSRPLPFPNSSTPLHLQPLSKKLTKPQPSNPLSPTKRRSIPRKAQPNARKPGSNSNQPSTPAQTLKQLLMSGRLCEARDFYAQLKSTVAEPGLILGSMLVDALMKAGRVSDAFLVFEAMSERNVVTWTSMISGCTRNGYQETGLSLFLEMLESGVIPNDFAFNAAVRACADMAELKLGEQVHSLIVRFGLEFECRVRNCLIDFYSRCGLVDKAELIFDGMPEQDLISFTSLISGFCRNNLFDSAVGVFGRIIREGFEPNEYTITSILTASGPYLGEQIHGYMIKTMISESIHSASALIEFYSRNYETEKAKLVFDKLEIKNVVTWSSMISCCVRNEQAGDAFEVFLKMITSGIEPNEYTFVTVLGACGLDTKSIALGRQVHSSIVKFNLMSEYHVLNALVTMYGKSGEINELEKVFGEIKDPDVVSWCAAISGYSQNGLDANAINMLCQMHTSGFIPNQYGISSALSSCANLALSDQGKQLHSLALKLGCDSDVCVGNALVNMYSKSGLIDDARLAFNVMTIRDVTSWNSLIHAYAHHGHGKKAIEVFDEMVANQVLPDHSTFVGLLFGCGHIGSVDQAVKYFNIMRDCYGVEPSVSHFACIIDMMGRAGIISEALHIINQMSFEPDILVWKTLLGSCRLQKNLEIGKLAAEKVIELSPQDSAAYVLLSNLHSMHGEWEDAERVRTMMDERGVKKDAGWSWIELRNNMHTFCVSDKSHPHSDDIYLMLEKLLKEMRSDDHSPDTSFMVIDF